jgi:hypothetical protein
MRVLGSLQPRLPHDLARAVDMNPDKMHDFVSYAYDSIQEPHSDYVSSYASRVSSPSFVVIRKLLLDN